MVFLFLALSLLSATARPDPLSTAYCLEEVSIDLERLQEIQAALTHILKPADEPRLAETVAMMDRALTLHVYHETRALSAVRRARLLAAIRDAEPDPTFNIFSPGTVSYSRERSPYLLYHQRLLASHPFLRLILAHEICHLIRFDALGDVPPEQSYRYIQEILVRRRHGLYREELLAFGSQYRYQRAAFGDRPLEYWLELFNQSDGYTSPTLHYYLRESFAHDESGFARQCVRGSPSYRRKQHQLEVDRRLHGYVFPLLMLEEFLDYRLPRFFGFRR